jgi:type III pantothenate kinase
MILLLDIGNTHTHLGLARNDRVGRRLDLPTTAWFDGTAPQQIERRAGKLPDGIAVCSVVPRTLPHVRRMAKAWNRPLLVLTAKNVVGIGIDYPDPETIGADRLANAVALRKHFGAPAVGVDFGTAVTFDVIDKAGNYAGGIIAPGLAAMTDYLHEKTALLPRIRIRETRAWIGKNTEQAMRIGAVHGYRGLIKELLAGLRRELGCENERLPVVATGGYARLMAAKLPEITRVDPGLTLEGLRLVWEGSISEV